MKKSVLLATILMLALAAAMLPGCDEDTTTPTGDDLVIGDTNSAEFEFADHWLGDNSMDNTSHSLELTLSLFELMSPQATPPAKDRQLLSTVEDDETIIIQGYSYSYDNGWHVFSFEAIVVNNITSDTTVDFGGVDSFQVTLDGDVMQVPDSSFNGFNVRAHYTWDSRIEDESGVAHHSLSLSETVDGLGTILSGSVHDTLHMAAIEEAPHCSIDLAIDQTLTDLTMVEGAPCPHSGSLSSSITVDLSCAGGESDYDSLDVNGTWTIAASIDGDVVHFTYSDGTTTWSATEPCSDSPPASPWAW